MFGPMSQLGQSHHIKATTAFRLCPGCPRTRPEIRSPSAYRERRIIRPAERHAGSDRLHRLEMDLALALVVAGVDERHRPLDDLHEGNVARRADLQTA